jgi:putative membrane protein
MMGLGIGGTNFLEFIINLLLTVLFLGSLIALGVWFVSKLSINGDSSNRQPPISILRERYAKGEITKEQFERIKKDLIKDTPVQENETL